MQNTDFRNKDILALPSDNLALILETIRKHGEKVVKKLYVFLNLTYINE